MSDFDPVELCRAMEPAECAAHGPWVRRISELEAALLAIRDFDASQGGPIAPRETPTSQAMRDLAAAAL